MVFENKLATALNRDENGWTIQGVVLFPKILKKWSGVQVEAFNDADFTKPVGKATTNDEGEFILEFEPEFRKNNAPPQQLWFKWTRDKTSYKTPKYNPWEPGETLRLAIYKERRKKADPKTSVPLTGSVTLSSGTKPTGYRVHLVAQTARTAQRLTNKVRVNDDGSFNLTYHTNKLEDPKNPDLIYQLFDAKDDLLQENTIPDFTVDDTQPAISSVNINPFKDALQFVQTLPGNKVARTTDIQYLLNRQQPSQQTSQLLQNAAAISKQTNISLHAALAIAASDYNTSAEALLTEAIDFAVVPKEAKAALEYDIAKHNIVQAEREDRNLRGLLDNTPALQDALKLHFEDDEPKRLAATKLWLDHRRSSQALAEALKNDEQLLEKADALLFTFELGERINRNNELLTVFARQFDNGQIAASSDLARWEISDWNNFIENENISVPEPFIEKDDEGEIDQSSSNLKFAANLRNTFERHYPQVAIRAHFENHQANYKWGNDFNALLQNHEDFDPLRPLPLLESEIQELKENKSLNASFAGFQRLYKLTESIEPIKPLLNAKLDSATAIAHRDPIGFYEQFQEAFKHAPFDPILIHKRAERAAALAKLTYFELSERNNSAPIEFFRKIDAQAREKQEAELSQEEKERLVTWRELFGNEDLGFCDCSHCRSVFGPAAYLFDMLLFLDRFDADQVEEPWSKFRLHTRGLSLINNAKDAGALVHCVKDNEQFWIGTLRAWGVRNHEAQLIMDERERLGGSFESLKQVLDIKGIGRDTLHDIIHTSWGDVGVRAAELALACLNSEKTPEALSHAIVDDDYFDVGSDRARGLPIRVATELVGYRGNLANSEFPSLREVNDVPGIGLDTLHDIIYSFYQEAYAELWPERRTLLDYFRVRRPDVPHLKLSCDNTNIEVPHIDLVNELLADLVANQKCLGVLPPSSQFASSRSTTGTSEERRAWPEHLPNPVALDMLKRAKRPWTLPYNYAQDLAEQTRNALQIDETDLISKLWKLTRLSSETNTVLQGDIEEQIYLRLLNLSSDELDLLTIGEIDIAEYWGEEIAEALEQGQKPSVAMIEHASRMDYYQLEEVLETKIIQIVMDGTHPKFTPCDECTPENITLDIDVENFEIVLHVIHLFERLRRKLDWTTHELDLALNHLNFEDFNQTIKILGLLRFVHNLLDIEPDQLFALFWTPSSEKPFTMRSEKRTLSQFERLFSTERLPDILEKEAPFDQNDSDAVIASLSHWTGIGPDEICFIFTEGYVIFEDIVLNKPIDLLFEETELPPQEDDEREAAWNVLIEKRVMAWKTAVSAIYRLDTLATAVDLSISESDGLLHLIEFETYFRDFSLESLEERIKETVQLSSIAKQIKEEPLSISELLYIATHRQSEVALYQPSQKQLGELLKKMHIEVTRLKETLPNLEEPLNESQEAVDNAIPDIDKLTDQEKEQKRAEELNRRKEVNRQIKDKNLPLAVQNRKVVENKVIEILATSLSLEVESATELSTQLLTNPDNASEPLLRAFVTEDSTTDGLLSSLVKASYSNQAVSDDNTDNISRLEPGLQFDWHKTPPPDGIDPQNFAVEIMATVLTSTIKTEDKIHDLIFDATGEITVSLADKNNNNNTIIPIDPNGDKWDKEKVKEFFDELAPGSESEILLYISYKAQNKAEADPHEPMRSTLSVMIEKDGETAVPLPLNKHLDAIVLLDKASRVNKAIPLPVSLWHMLASVTNEKTRVDLNKLARMEDNYFQQWLQITAIKKLWARANDETNLSILQALASQRQITKSDLAIALYLTPAETDMICMFFGVTANGEQITFPEEVSWGLLEATLALSDLARSNGLSLLTIIQWLTAPPEQFYQFAIGALHASRPQEQWLNVLQTIHDPVRENLRDALVDWLISYPRQDETGQKIVPFRNPEEISDHFLTDIQMTACYVSSRVQFGYAAVQRYIDGIRLGFIQPGPTKALIPNEMPADERFEREWEWRRFYRLWEANRRVFVNPENWLEPELRPNKSEFFQQLEDELMEGPLTTAAAERALAHYLGKVINISRPEIIGVVHADGNEDQSPFGFRDPDLQGTHIFARSRNQPYQLYYRRRLPVPDSRWMPWELIDTDIGGTHFMPFIANRRLYLMSAEFGIGKAQPNLCDCDESNLLNSFDPRRYGQVVISMIERRHGQWSKVSRYEPIDFDTSIIGVDVGSSLDTWVDFPYKSGYFNDLQYKSPKISKVHWAVKSGDEDTIESQTGVQGILTLRDSEYVFLIKEPNTAEWEKGKWKSGDIFINPPLFPSEFKWMDIKLLSAGNDNDDGHFREIKIDLQTEDNSLHPSNSWRKWVKPGIKLLDENDNGQGTKNIRIYIGAHSERLYKLTAREFVNKQIQNKGHFFNREISEESAIPPEVFAFQIKIADSASSKPVEIQLIAQNDVSFCRNIRRKYQFVGELPREVEGKWTTEWVPGEEICVEQTSRFQPLITLELFPDGTLQKSKDITPSDRGGYEGTKPFAQFFQSSPDYLDENSETSTERIFFLEGLRNKFYVPRSYRLIVSNQEQISTYMTPKILDENSEASEGRTFFIRRHELEEFDFSPLKDPYTYDIYLAWECLTFWHPHSSSFLQLLHAGGSPRLLAHKTQTLEDTELIHLDQSKEFFEEEYVKDLNPPIITDYPTADVDFSDKGTYSDYNWEMFFHAPLLIAKRLSEEGQFEEAERWFRLLFDPANGRLNKNPLDAFQTRPLRESNNIRLKDMVLLLNDPGQNEIKEKFKSQVARLNLYPYQPHLIARGRLSAYQKVLFIKYLDHLIAWGDELFRRAYATDNRTELENASSRYDLVIRMLGKKPEILPEQSTNQLLNFNELAHGEDELSLWAPVVQAENYLSSTSIRNLILPTFAETDRKSTKNLPNEGEGIPELLYFCIPPNEIILKYWDTLADRLQNLRACRDIEGVERVLSLYGRRIDPALLVRATALGLDIDVVLGLLAAPSPRFRFNILLQRAKSASERVNSFGQSFLSVIEKGDSEELVRLRTKHELALLKASKKIRGEQVKEAEESLNILWRSRENAETRFTFYSTRTKINLQEMAESNMLELAAKYEETASESSSSAADRALIPNFPINAEIGVRGSIPGIPEGFWQASGGVNYNFGGQLFSNISQQKASQANYFANNARSIAQKMSRQAHFNRRYEDWDLQKELAAKDLNQIDKQIASAMIRLRITEIEEENQQLQIEQALVVETYMRDKFSNTRLYRWMQTRLSRLHYQQYRIAYDLAQKAQFAMRYELGLDTDDPDAFLPDTWDASRRGMNAATDLLHELEKMEKQYIDTWRREHEKTKVFSLANRWPLEFLELLRTGSCIIHIQEHDLDEDEPGDYLRRIKQVSVDIPCIKDSDTSINARFTLQRSEVRKERYNGNGNYEKDKDGEDKRFRIYPATGDDHIVTSSGVNDSGQHNPNPNGETLLPFEGAGVISSWKIDLDPDTNHFDLSTVTDVKMTFLYTSRDGGEEARIKAKSSRQSKLKEDGRWLLLPIQTYFSNSWAKFTTISDDPKELSLKISSEILPFQFKKWVKLNDLKIVLSVDAKIAGNFELESDEDFEYSTWPIVLPNDSLEYHVFGLRPAKKIELDRPISIIRKNDSKVPIKGWGLIQIKPK